MSRKLYPHSDKTATKLIRMSNNKRRVTLQGGILRARAEALSFALWLFFC